MRLLTILNVDAGAEAALGTLGVRREDPIRRDGVEDESARHPVPRQHGGEVGTLLQGGGAYRDASDRDGGRQEGEEKTRSSHPADLP